MRFKLCTSFGLAVFFLCTASSVVSQTVPDATQGNSLLAQFAVGAGVSSYDVDWGHGRMAGGTFWIDWHPNHIPLILNGLGLEVEARDISLDHSASQSSNFRLDTAGGGVIYNWRHFRNFDPYGKFVMSFGGIDWNNPNPLYKHETRTVTAYGLGFEYRVFRHIWARADYEYQFWPQIALMDTGGHVLNPQGFSIGPVYNFHGFSHR